MPVARRMGDRLLNVVSRMFTITAIIMGLMEPIRSSAQNMSVDPKTLDTWEGTLGDGLLRRSGGRIDRFHQLNSGLAGNIVFAVAIVEGRLWAVTNGGVSVYDLAADVWETRLPRNTSGIESDLIDPDSSSWAVFPPAIKTQMRAALQCAFAPAARRTSSTENTPRKAVGVLGSAGRFIKLPPVPSPRERGANTDSWPDLLAIQLAFEQFYSANPNPPPDSIELVTPPGGYAHYGWGLPEDNFVYLHRDERVLGVVGDLHPRRAILNALIRCSALPLVNTAPAIESPSLAELDDSWVFRCWADQPRQHRLFLEHLFVAKGCARFAIIRTPGSATSRHLNWWRSHLECNGRPVIREVVWSEDRSQNDEALATLVKANSDAVLSWCAAETAADLLRGLRNAGSDAIVVGGPDLLQIRLTNRLGFDPGRVFALLPSDTDGGVDDHSEFTRVYAERNVIRSVPTAPGENAYRCRNAADHLMEAVNSAEPNRLAVRDTLDVMARSALGELHYERTHPRAQARIAYWHADDWVIETISAN